MLALILQWLQIWGMLILSWGAVIIGVGFLGALLTGQIGKLKEGGISSIIELFFLLAKFTLFLLIVFVPPVYIAQWAENAGFSHAIILIGFLASFVASVRIALLIYEAIDIALRKYGYRGD
ncbi:MAG: hypothetical protein PHH57_05815 [Candidatus Omnitrophica bacterium]|nr:hypothetical protein [Candidatus Omnitrophota bacterium]